MTEHEEAAAGVRVKALLEDVAVRDALGKLERQFYEDFKRAKSDEERRRAQAQAAVLEVFCEKLMAVVARGQAAQKHLNDEQRKQDAEAERKKKYGR